MLSSLLGGELDLTHEYGWMSIKYAYVVCVLDGLVWSKRVQTLFNSPLSRVSLVLK